MNLIFTGLLENPNFTPPKEEENGFFFILILEEEKFESVNVFEDLVLPF